VESISYVMKHYQWAWPTAECLHFIGLCLLIGTVGVFDLRMIGFLRRIPLGALHRLIPWGVFGYGINVVTGVSFLSTYPDQYHPQSRVPDQNPFHGNRRRERARVLPHDVPQGCSCRRRSAGAVGRETCSRHIFGMLDRCDRLRPIPYVLPSAQLLLVSVVLRAGHEYPYFSM
jgi:hypothetical protein